MACRFECAVRLLDTIWATHALRPVTGKRLQSSSTNFPPCTRMKPLYAGRIPLSAVAKATSSIAAAHRRAACARIGLRGPLDVAGFRCRS